REAKGVDDVFEVVAEQLRRVTASQGAALCLADEAGLMTFTRFSPALPWGELAAGLPLDRSLARRLEAAAGRPERVALERENSPLSRGLEREGFRTALLVPLSDWSARGAALLLASHDPEAYPDAQIEVVSALASHLGSALGAAHLHTRLQSA